MTLTKSELEMMHVIWDAGRPVSRNEILAMAGSNKSWKDSSVHILLNGLLRKQAIKEDGFVKCGKTYGRLFSANISREAYYAEEVFAFGGRESVPALLSALLHRDGLDDALLDELVTIIKDKKGELKK